MAAAAAAAAGAGNGRGRPASALLRRLHLRWGVAGLRRARAGGAAWGPARLDAEPVSAGRCHLGLGWRGRLPEKRARCGLSRVRVKLFGLESSARVVVVGPCTGAVRRGEGERQGLEGGRGGDLE